jgi:hypothetical protein
VLDLWSNPSQTLFISCSMSHLIELNDAWMNRITSSEPRPIWVHWVAVYTLNWDHLTWLCGSGSSVSLWLLVCKWSWTSPVSVDTRIPLTFLGFFNSWSFWARWDSLLLSCTSMANKVSIALLIFRSLSDLLQKHGSFNFSYVTCWHG